MNKKILALFGVGILLLVGIFGYRYMKTNDISTAENQAAVCTKYAGEEVSVVASEEKDGEVVLLAQGKENMWLFDFTQDKIMSNRYALYNYSGTGNGFEYLFVNSGNETFPSRLFLYGTSLPDNYCYYSINTLTESEDNAGEYHVTAKGELQKFPEGAFIIDLSPDNAADGISFQITVYDADKNAVESFA